MTPRIPMGVGIRYVSKYMNLVTSHLPDRLLRHRRRSDTFSDVGNKLTIMSSGRYWGRFLCKPF